MTADSSARAAAARRVPGRSPILDVVSDLHDDVAAARFPLDLPGAAELRALRERVEVRIGAHLLPRLKREEGPAVVVLGGATGVGKSTLVNSVVGAEVSPAGVVRPTTTTPVLAVRGEDAWLVSDHPVTELAALVTHDDVPAGLALLDAPDLDSVRDGNRDLANLLLETADLWLFVTTAARYGDAVPWRVLQEAHERGITVAVVLNRVPRAVLGEVRADLLDRLVELDMGEAPLFVVEDVGPHECLLPEHVIEPVRTWLSLLGGRATSRGVVRRTTQGVWGTLRDELLDLADGITAQAMAAGTLRSRAEQAVSAAAGELVTALGTGVASQGAPTTRWLSAASTGGPLAGLLSAPARLRAGWRGARRAERDHAAIALGEETRAALTSLIVDAATGAEAALRHAWSETGRGAESILERATDPATRRERATAALAQWAQRTDATADRVAAEHRQVLAPAGVSGLLQAAAAGLDGAARALRALGIDNATIDSVRTDLHETATATVGAEAAPYLERLDALGLRSDQGAGLRLRASELKDHR